VVWHPGDHAGDAAAKQLISHFHGNLFSGLMGGAVEVYVRSAGWRSAEDSPRPIHFPHSPPFHGVPQPSFVAVVPVTGYEFASVVESGEGPWYRYAEMIRDAAITTPEQVGVFPLVVDPEAAGEQTMLAKILLRRFQSIAASPVRDEPEAQLRCRDLAQGITKLASGPAASRLTVFLSHTKRAGTPDETADIAELIDLVRQVIRNTRLNEFFDAHDLQPGEDWDAALREHASTGALLALRTDRYASRNWCQREFLIAKRYGVPVVICDALVHGEERGSFLMDHVPRVPLRSQPDGWRMADIRRALNLLVDECLKRALWNRQGSLSRADFGPAISWWASHAPEPVTLSAWLAAQRRAGRTPTAEPIQIVHPDPPLGVDETKVLHEIAVLSGYRGGVDIMTPRMLAARGG
jgi:hypothetical protein